MATKEELISNVKGWMRVEGEIKELQREIKSKREIKKSLTNKLVDVMKDNEIDCFDVKNGQILYTQKKSKVPLNKKTLLLALEKFYPDEHDRVNELGNFIMETREENVKESIRLKEQK